MAIQPNVCPTCGEPHWGTGHECKPRKAAKSVQTTVQAEKPIPAPHQPEKRKPAQTSTGTPVMVRLQPDMLEKLDKARGGSTRPQKIRDILEQAL